MATRLLDSAVDAAGFPPGWMGRVAETIAGATDPSARSTALLALVDEIYTTTEWMLGGSPDQTAELGSLSRVLAEVQDHHRRMAAGPT